LKTQDGQVKIAFLFPGQGAQQVGMMADLAQASAAAREIFHRADEQLGYSLSQICFNGPADRLDTTEISQPAMFVCSVAAWEAMKEALGDNAPEATVCAGLSLGEYTALHVAGAIDFASALDLVCKRGKFMQESAQSNAGGMVSIIGLEEQKVRELCSTAAEGEVLIPANFNCPGQIVISGTANACKRAIELAPQFGASAAIALKVAGAFHSSLMAEAAKKLSEVIEKVNFNAPKIPVIANVDASPYQDAKSIKDKLIRQMTEPVLWEQSMRRLLDEGVEKFYEIGPGKVLAGLMRRINRQIKVESINSADALAKLAGQAA